MASSYTLNTGIEKPTTGEQAGTWGTTTNTNFDIIDRALNGVGAVTLSGTTHTLTTSDGSLSDGMFKVLVLGGDGYLGWPTAMHFSKKKHQVYLISLQDLVMLKIHQVYMTHKKD